MRPVVTDAARRRRLVHVTTTDISLELLIGPQLEAFAEAGYEVIGVSAPGEFVDAIQARGIEHVPLRNATRSMDPRADLMAIGELHRLFRRIRPDIVHTHNPKPGLYGRIAAGLAQIPVVVNTVHGLYALPGDDWRKKLVVCSLERLASVFSDAELVQNPEDMVTLRQVLREPTSKLTLLGNGVDLQRFTDDRFGAPENAAATRRRIRDEIGARDDTIVVGAVGRLVLEKGYTELFEAWEALRSDHPAAMLVVAGPVDAAKADALPARTIEAAERCGVKFLGMRDDVEDLYVGLDVYVLASHREGFPRSAMEAAASGLPIIATDIRGCRQVVDHGRNGLLVPVRSTRSLQEAISCLVGDAGLRQDMAEAAATKAREDFDQQRVIDRTLATYARLLTAAGTGPPRPAGM